MAAVLHAGSFKKDCGFSESMGSLVLSLGSMSNSAIVFMVTMLSSWLKFWMWDLADGAVGSKELLNKLRYERD